MFYSLPSEASLQTLDRLTLSLFFPNYPILSVMNDLLVCIVKLLNFCDRLSDRKLFSVRDYHLPYYTYFHDVCEYIQKYSLACPWLLSWPDMDEGDLMDEEYDSEFDA